jgi:hypothetical protein
MMREVLEESFKVAHERYAGAVRMAFVIVAALLALHITTVSQYVLREQAVRATRQEKEKALRLEEITKRMVASAGELDRLRQSQTKILIDDFVQVLIDDFSALNDSIRQARGQQQEQLAPQLQVQQQMQMVRPLVRVIPDELLEKLDSITDSDRLREEFAPWITDTLIAPRVDELRQGWKLNLWPPLRSHGEALAAQISQAKELLSENSALMVRLAQLSEQVKALLIKGESFQFRVPENTTWWQTVSGKMATGITIGEQSAKELEIGIVRELVEASQQAAAAAKQEAELIFAEQVSARKALENGFEEQKKRADDLAKPLTYIALDLALVAGSFPLLLGFGLGVAFIWPGWRRRELLRTWATLIALDPEWKAARPMVGSVAKEFFTLLLALIAALAWIAVAGWQLVRSGLITAQDSQKLCLQGSIVVIVAVAWRLYENHRIAKSIPALS